MGFVVLAGLFEPGTVVELFEIQDGDFRVETQPVAGKRLADANGSVGFDGLDEGARFIARGKDVYGNPIEERAVALSEQEGSEVAQEPIRPASQTMGFSETSVPAQPAGAPDAILHVGVPAGLPLGVTAS